MADTWDTFKSTSKNFWGDPAGYATGTNKEGAGGVKKMLFGDPEGIKKAYDDAMAKAEAMGQQGKQFLLGQQGKALAYYAPLQQMFNNAYGNQGLQSPQIPQAQGQGGPLARMYGGGQ